LPKINIKHEERPKQKAVSRSTRRSRDEEEYEEEEEEERSAPVTSQSIKKIIQNTLINKIEQKEKERIQNKPMISF